MADGIALQGWTYKLSPNVAWATVWRCFAFFAAVERAAVLSKECKGGKQQRAKGRKEGRKEGSKHKETHNIN